MTKSGILMIGCAAIAAVFAGAAGVAAAEPQQADRAEDELAEAPDVAPNTIGQFHTIRVANTNLCVQPQGGSAGSVVVELATCSASAPAQNWLFRSLSGGTEIVNNLSGKCLYNSGTNPPVNGSGPILVNDCNITGTTAAASNALWSPSALTGFASLKTNIGHRSNNFCLDVPGANPFPGAALQIWGCNGTPAQVYVVGQE
jgi:hypothetical protein